MIPLTFWAVWDQRENAWVFNHAELGHSTTDKPKPKDTSFTAQHGWATQDWTREHVWRNPDGSEGDT